MPRKWVRGVGAWEIDAVHGHVEHVQENNGAENTVPGPQGDTTTINL